MTTVLYIEDDPGLAKLVQRRLDRAAITVHLAGDGTSGLNMLASHNYRVLLVDYWLPDQNGMEVMQAVLERRNPPSVIMLTAMDDVTVAVAAMKQGAADYLTKDSEGQFLDLLPSVIDRVLINQRLIAERHQAQELAQITLRSIDDAVVTTDSEGRITYLNGVAERMCGWTLREVENGPVDMVFHAIEEASGNPLPSLARSVISGGEVLKQQNHTLLIDRNGGELPIEYSVSPILGTSDEIIGAVLVFRDVSERREFERNLDLIKKVFQHTSEAIMITDPDGTIIDVNEAFSNITGYARDEVVGQSPSMMKSGRHDTDFFRVMWSALQAGGEWQGEIWDRRKSGEIYPKWLSINAVTSHTGQTTHYVGIFNDISSIKQTEERLHRLAHYDPLTGLPNRMLFSDRLQQALYQAARHQYLVALMFIDLDRFKVINDTLGHQAGDDLLVGVAERLKQQVRESDTVARLGGDEFTIILPEVESPQSAAHVAQKIIDAFALPFRAGQESVFSSPSIGIGIYPLTGEDTETLIKTADIAMYNAKQRGRNNYQFYRGDLDALAHAELRLENDLRQALARDELRLFYQPLLEMKNGGIIGMEALLRWQHPERGLLLPGDFIDIAEETGLIVEIGRWVIEQACTQNRRWHEEGLGPLRVAVNVSARQITHGDFISDVTGILSRTGLAPEQLDLEVTESSVILNIEQAAGVLRELRQLGVRISVDDFGTGYSSLSYLKRLPVDTLKIDKSFIHDLDRNDDDAAISKAIIALSRSLNLRVVAEGVETEAQMCFLRAEKCCDAQGFYFSHPIPGEEATRYLVEHRPAG